MQENGWDNGRGGTGDPSGVSVDSSISLILSEQKHTYDGIPTLVRRAQHHFKPRFVSGAGAELFCGLCAASSYLGSSTAWRLCVFLTLLTGTGVSGLCCCCDKLCSISIWVVLDVGLLNGCCCYGCPM